MVRGPKQVEADGKMVVLSAGESLLVRKRSQVRYAQPFRRACRILVRLPPRLLS